MKAADWIDRVKLARGWDSDYRAAKELGLSRNTISNYRGGLRHTLDEDTSVKVAAALGERPEVILVDQAAERTRNVEVRSALGRVLERIGGVMSNSGGGPDHAEGPPSLDAHGNPALNISKSAVKVDRNIHRIKQAVSRLQRWARQLAAPCGSALAGA